MKILESYKKIAKSMLTEYAWDRKFGEPLPTLDDVMREASQDDDDYVSIGFGRFKEKDSVDDPSAPTFKKDDSGTFVPTKGEDKEKEPKDDMEEPEEPKSKGLGKGDFEREFDDEEPSGEPEGGGDFTKSADYDMWSDDEDDEEARAQAFKDMEDEDDKKEEIIIINGKKYRPIKESPEPTIFDPKKHLLREMYERIGGK